MEDEFGADEFGGSLVEVGTAQRLGADAPQRGRTRRTRMRFGANRRRGRTRIRFGANRRRAQGGEDEGDAFDMDGHAEDDGVEVFAEHSDEGRIGGLEMVAETGTLVGCEAELTRAIE